MSVISPIEAFEACRPRLTALAYRMLGERMAAEDVVQDAWLRWQGVDHAGIRSAEAWLTTATTRLAIDALRQAKARRETYVGPWLPEPLLDDPATDFTARIETSQQAELALMWAMEFLTPDERAAFILREAFDAEYGAIAEALGRSEAACRQLVSRARRKTGEGPARTGAGREAVMTLLIQLLEANASGDLDRIAELLAEDVVAISDGGGKASAALRPLYGVAETAQVMHALATRKLAGVDPLLLTVNGQPAVAVLEGGELDFISTVVPSRADPSRIGWIYTMRNPDKLPPRPA